MPLKIIRQQRQKKKIGDSRNTSTAQEMGEICNKLVFSTFDKVNEELKVMFACKKQDLTRNLVPGRKQVMFYCGPSFQTPLAWLGESAENQSWHSLGETLIGNFTAKTASVVSEAFGCGPQLEKGAEMDHMEIGVQRYCIWKANFPGCCRLKMSNCLKKQTQ